MSDYIDQVFGEAGILAGKFPGYAPRAGQLALTRAIDAAFARERVLAAEGPCGSGKSLAYLVPATYHAAKHGRRVLVVTAGIALQEQLVSKDLPMLKSALPWTVDFALLKGRSNYLCLSQLGALETKGALEERTPEIDALLVWAHSTTTGDVSELPTVPSYQAWSKFSVGADDCKGKPCKFHSTCHAENARRAAKQARVIVANYHILFTHLAIKIATGKDLVLPPFDAVIWDEADQAADIAREFFGWRVTAGTIAHVAKKLGDARARQELEAASARFFDGLKAIRQAKEYKARLRKPPTLDAALLLELLGKAAAVYRAHYENHSAAGDKDAAAGWNLARQAAERCAGRVALAMRAVGYGRESNDVFFVELDEKGRPSLNAKQIDVSAALAGSLWTQVKTSVLTSATITVGGSFEHLAREVGLDRAPGGYDTCAAESPFAWKRQALLVVPKDAVPDPNHPTFDVAAYRAVKESILAASGRTLAIFTSNKRLNEAHAVVKGAVPYRVLRQGEAPRTQLVASFREDVSSVLMGTKSFWTGVDVSGEALSCVVIDRLPFPTPDDPIADVIAERDPDSFFTYMIPRAVTALKQGFGRLIRAMGDKGAVVVLDKRLVTKGYGRTFLKSLPACAMSTEIADVAVFLAAPDASSGAA